MHETYENPVNSGNIYIYLPYQLVKSRISEPSTVWPKRPTGGEVEGWQVFQDLRHQPFEGLTLYSILQSVYIWSRIYNVVRLHMLKACCKWIIAVYLGNGLQVCFYIVFYADQFKARCSFIWVCFNLSGFPYKMHGQWIREIFATMNLAAVTFVQAFD